MNEKKKSTYSIHEWKKWGELKRLMNSVRAPYKQSTARNTIKINRLVLLVRLAAGARAVNYIVNKFWLRLAELWRVVTRDKVGTWHSMTKCPSLTLFCVCVRIQNDSSLAVALVSHMSQHYTLQYLEFELLITSKYCCPFGAHTSYFMVRVLFFFFRSNSLVVARIIHIFFFLHCLCAHYYFVKRQHVMELNESAHTGNISSGELFFHSIYTWNDAIILHYVRQSQSIIYYLLLWRIQINCK